MIGICVRKDKALEDELVLILLLLVDWMAPTPVQASLS